MHKRTLTVLSMALGVGGLLIACSPSSEAGATASASSSGKAGQRSGSSATGNLVVEGDWQGQFSTLERGSKAHPEPLQETWGLRLNFGEGEDEYPRALLEVRRLPATLADGTYALGSDGVARGEMSLRPKDPAGSGIRFSLTTGHVVLRRTGDQVSGSWQVEGKEVTFDKPVRRIQLRGEFTDVAVKQ